jgi:hypothetical protein
MMKRQFKLLVTIFVLVLPTVCATGAPKPGDKATIIDGVPFFSQEAYQCGSAALATVLDYWYRKTGTAKWVKPEDIAAEIYSPTAKGVL